MKSSAWVTLLPSLCGTKRTKNDAKLFSVGHEYMLVYANSLPTLKQQGTIWREQKAGAAEIAQKWKELVANHGERLADIQTELRAWYRGLPGNHPSKKMSRYKWVDRFGPWRDRDISWPGGGGPRYEVLHPTTQKPCKIPDDGWRVATKEEIERQIAIGLVEFRPGTAYVRRFARHIYSRYRPSYPNLTMGMMRIH